LTPHLSCKMFRSSGVTVFCTWALVIFAFDVSALPVEDEQRPDPLISLMAQTATNDDEVPGPREFDLDVGASALLTCAGEDLRARPQKEWCNWDPARRTPQECRKYFVTKGKAPPFKHLQCKFMDGNCITGDECTLQADTSPPTRPCKKTMCPFSHPHCGTFGACYMDEYEEEADESFCCTGDYSPPSPVTPAPKMPATPAPVTPAPKMPVTPAPDTPAPISTPAPDTPAPASTSRFAEAGSKPNIILYLTDDWPYALWPDEANEKDRDGVDNHYGELLPNIKRLLVTEGMEIKYMYSHLYCSPSRRALLTGRFASSITSATGDCLDTPLKLATFAQQLKPGGYSTHFLGKWQLGWASHEALPQSRGFDTALGFHSQQVEPYGFSIQGLSKNKGKTSAGENMYDLIDSAHYNVNKSHPLIAGALGKLRYYCSSHDLTQADFPDAKGGGRLALFQQNDRAALEAIAADEQGREINQDSFDSAMVQAIESAGNRPFFIWQSTSAVHFPFDSKHAQRQRVWDVRRDKFTSEAKCPWYELYGDDDASGHAVPVAADPELCDACGRDKRFEVEAMAVAVDDSLKLAELTLRNSGQWDNTIILFMSDNGGALNKMNPNTPMRGGKYTHQEGGVHVRSAMGGGHLPAELRGLKSSTVVHFVDFWPTFRHLAGLEPDTVGVDPKWDDGKPVPPIDGVNVAPSWRRFYDSRRARSSGSGNELVSDAIGSRVIVHGVGLWSRGRAYSYITPGHLLKVYAEGCTKQCANHGGKCVWEGMKNGGTHLEGCTSANPCIFDIVSDLSEAHMQRYNDLSADLGNELRRISAKVFAISAPAPETYWTSRQTPTIVVGGKDCSAQSCKSGYSPLAAADTTGQYLEQACYSGRHGSNDILALRDQYVKGPWRD